jgi:VanZ family protein
MNLNDRDNRLKKILHRLPIEDGKYICRLIYSDPLKDIYWVLLIIYVLILAGFILWPFDFYVYVKNDARWIGNSKGIEFLETGQAVSNSSTQEFFDRMIKGSGLTLELWLQTEDQNQFGPARILSYSIDPTSRNFTIGQSYDQLVVRLRTTRTSLNGTNPHLIVDDTFNDRSLQHVVVAYDFSEQRVYINGEQRTRSEILKGDFSNWDPDCRLAIGNEVTGNRPWEGKIYYVAIFNKPLTDREIRQNYLSGMPSKINKEKMENDRFKARIPVARYLFNERKGDTIHDSGSNLSPANLFIPKYIRRGTKSFPYFSKDYLKSNSWFSDVIINILIFIPLGILLHGMLRARWGLTLKISLAALLAGTLFTLGVESMQHFSATRNSSLIDVATNMSGTALGIAMDRVYNLFLNYRTDRLQMLLFDRIE